VVFLWAAIFIVACSQGSNADSDVSTLNRGLSGEPESLDPHRSASNQAIAVLRDIGEGLISFAADGTLEAGVADRWEESSDSLTFTFHLRPEARWSNGSKVLASDFEFAFQRLVDPQTAAPYAGFVSAIRNANEIVRGELPKDKLGVVAIGPLTLQIRLHTPTPHFLQLLAHPSTFPINEVAYRSIGEKIFTPGNYVSNGAYTLIGWTVGSSISLRRNKLFWDNESTYIEKVVYHFVNQNIEFDRYRAGELDITANVPESIFSNVSKDRPSELRVSPYLGIYYFGFNLSKAPFSENQKLRQALSLAIDRQIIVDKITGRGEIPAYSWVPPGVNLYTQQESEFAILGKTDREEMARQLFVEAGFGPGTEFEFELRYNTFDGHKRIALAVQGMWRSVLGIEVNLVNEEFKVFIDSVRSKNKTEVFRLSWTGDYNDALSFLQIMKSDNPSNLTGYSNTEFDQFVALAEREPNPVLRKSQLEKAERIAMADYPVIPLYFYVSKHLVSPSIVGWENNVMDVHLSKHLSLAKSSYSR
jgi:oligopeptide transport system substrate-binding protein